MSPNAFCRQPGQSRLLAIFLSWPHTLLLSRRIFQLLQETAQWAFPFLMLQSPHISCCFSLSQKRVSACTFRAPRLKETSMLKTICSLFLLLTIFVPRSEEHT